MGKRHSLSCLKHYLEACVLRNDEVFGEISDIRHLNSTSGVDGY